MLVVNYAHTTYNDIESCMKKIKIADMNMFGFILNNVDIKKKAGYYSSYNYKYYKYGYGENNKKKK